MKNDEDDLYDFLFDDHNDKPLYLGPISPEIEKMSDSRNCKSSIILINRIQPIRNFASVPPIKNEDLKMEDTQIHQNNIDLDSKERISVIYSDKDMKICKKPVVKRKRMTKNEKAAMTPEELADRKKKQDRNNSAIYAAKKNQPMIELNNMVPQLEMKLKSINDENYIKKEKYLNANGQFSKLKIRENQIYENISAKHKNSIEKLEKEYMNARKMFDDVFMMTKPEDVKPGTFGSWKVRVRKEFMLAELKYTAEKLKMKIEMAQNIGQVLKEMMI